MNALKAAIELLAPIVAEVHTLTLHMCSCQGCGVVFNKLLSVRCPVCTLVREED